MVYLHFVAGGHFSAKETIAPLADSGPVRIHMFHGAGFQDFAAVFGSTKQSSECAFYKSPFFAANPRIIHLY